MNERVNLLTYRICHAIVAGFCRAFWRLRIDGREHIPATGPFVLSPVHRSNIDSPLAALVTTRRLRFMAKDSLWKFRPLGWLVSALGGFPVRRGSADREALRMAVEVLERGEPLVIFPEGTRKEGPVVENLFDGAAYVAAKCGVPIVPVGIGGSARAMRPGSKMIRPARVHMIVGPPLHPPPVEDGARMPRRAIRELTEELRVEVQRLFDEAQKVADPET